MSDLSSFAQLKMANLVKNTETVLNGSIRALLQEVLSTLLEIIKINRVSQPRASKSCYEHAASAAKSRRRHRFSPGKTIFLA